MEFKIHNSTRITFGWREFSRLGAMVVNYGKKGLVACGGFIVERSVMFDRTVIEPNLLLTTARRGFKSVKSEKNGAVAALVEGGTMGAAESIAVEGL